MIEWGESAAAKAGPVPLVFLFGAGASHGAIGVTPYPPPLGCDLYEALAEQFPKTWGVASQFAGVADKFKKDFEAAMEQYCNEHSATAVVSALNDMARYFAARLASAVKIIVIGARPNDHDTHVWAPLRDCGKEVLYVGGDYASIGISRSRLLGLTFEGAWASLLGELDAIAPNFTNYPERVAERR